MKSITSNNLPSNAQTRGRTDTAGIEILVLDFDGVLTDNRVLVDQDGREAVFCHRGDGWGIAQLRKTGLRIIVLSTEANPVVQARCNKMHIECIQDCPNKLERLKKLASDSRLSPSQIAYVGNDVNDLECMQWVGIPIAVADAVPEILGVACRVTQRNGGYGAVRDVCDWILADRERTDV